VFYKQLEIISFLFEQKYISTENKELNPSFVQLVHTQIVQKILNYLKLQ